MQISSRAYLDYANHNISTGIRTAVAAFLLELDRRGVEFTDEFTLCDLATQVRNATGHNLLDEEE